jgi:hypothetical protein
MIDVLHDRRQAASPTPHPTSPTGWYNPDSSAFEPLTGVAAVSDAVAGSLEADRAIDTPPIELDED